MISVKEAQEIIKQNIPQKKQQILPLKEAFGYTTSEDIYSKYNIPNFLQSSMDGYAIRFQDRNQPLKIVGEIPAGCTEQFQLKKGTAYRIFTGAPLPFGADTVVMQEKVIVENNKLIIEERELEEGLNVRPIGSDAKINTVAISSDSYLSAAAIGYLAGIGCTKVKVYAPSSVSLILTGNELKKPGETLEFGQIFESNTIQLESVLRQSGIQKIDTFWVKDNPEEIQKVLESAVSKTDIVLLVGGVSVGDYDFVIEATKICEIQQQFHKIKQKPGKPLYFGTKGEKLVFGLPGNPSSALTCFYLYVAPLLSELTKKPAITNTTTATVTSTYKKKKGLTHFLKAIYKDGKVSPLHAQESYKLQSFAEANCLIILSEESEGCEKDEVVEIIILK
ncbi:molybdopterin molybdotransferase MoeA [Epilithonimonas vandammei]|uniref:molybdopterin molybdotransferase MoeA n=1 Tax=Epilithonimonas vandammei TaxID=2487072 RepID=UPI0028B14CE4|nr:gephyrin-like molybdotransferase Glp [Epilithonimonas vandammei]